MRALMQLPQLVAVTPLSVSPSPAVDETLWQTQGADAR